MEKEKYLITFSSGNRITGEMMVTTSPRATCPTSCPLKDGDCYAENGHLGHWLWGGLDRTSAGDKINGKIQVYSFKQLLTAIRLLIPGGVWRHNQAGDLSTLADDVTIDPGKLRQLVEANRGRKCFTFTHHDVIDNVENREAVKEACSAGFMVNLSADSLEEADALADLEIAPVSVVVPAGTKENMTTPKGRTVAICPARRVKGVTCASCQICTKYHKAIIAFPQL